MYVCIYVVVRVCLSIYIYTFWPDGKELEISRSFSDFCFCYGFRIMYCDPVVFLYTVR